MHCLLCSHWSSFSRHSCLNKAIFSNNKKKKGEPTIIKKSGVYKVFLNPNIITHEENISQLKEPNLGARHSSAVKILRFNIWIRSFMTRTRKSTRVQICFHVLLCISYLKICKAFKKNQKEEKGIRILSSILLISVCTLGQWSGSGVHLEK